MKNYIDLIEQLSDQDKRILTNYITTYGVAPENFMGVDKWLQNWSHSNQKLYKLLGNKLIVKVPIHYEKSSQEIENDIRKNLLTMPFVTIYKTFFQNIIVPLCNQGVIDEIAKQAFSSLTDSVCFVNNQTYLTIKIKKSNNSKLLQIQSGTKIMKAFSKVIEYFKDDFTFMSFEDFRVKHSIMLTDRKVSGYMVLSIHPMDFITMSDNDSNWSSCMSWKEDGCYHVGTIEMMNSNNVICCYLENSNPFCFGKDNSEDYTWNNKKWRELAYITKDIIMSGKAYPFINDYFSTFIINTLKDLAQKNLNWKYKYGPELYKDMLYINSSYCMDRVREYRKMRPIKKNILWDTKGMYNDMLNAKVNYWCYRNAVDKTKIISVSGKANCCSCGDPIIEESGYYDEYNERFNGVHRVICNDCYCEQVYSCESCAAESLINPLYEVVDDQGIIKNVCAQCYSKYMRECPCCGKTTYFDIYRKFPIYYCFGGDVIKKRVLGGEVFSNSNLSVFSGDTYTYEEDTDPNKFKANLYSPDNTNYTVSIETVFVCGDCYDKLLPETHDLVYRKYSWGSRADETAVRKVMFDPKYEKYRYKYLNTPKGDPFFTT